MTPTILASVILLALMVCAMLQGFGYSNAAEDARNDYTLFNLESANRVALELDEHARGCAKWALLYCVLAVTNALWVALS